MRKLLLLLVLVALISTPIFSTNIPELREIIIKIAEEFQNEGIYTKQIRDYETGDTLLGTATYVPIDPDIELVLFGEDYDNYFNFLVLEIAPGFQATLEVESPNNGIVLLLDNAICKVYRRIGVLSYNDFDSKNRVYKPSSPDLRLPTIGTSDGSYIVLLDPGYIIFINSYSEEWDFNHTAIYGFKDDIASHTYRVIFEILNYSKEYRKALGLMTGFLKINRAQDFAKALAITVAQNLKTLASSFENKAYVDGCAPKAITELGRDIDTSNYGLVYTESKGKYTVVVFSNVDVDFATIQSILKNATNTPPNVTGYNELSDGLGVSDIYDGTVFYSFSFVVY